MRLWTLKYVLKNDGGVYVEQVPAPTRGQAERYVSHRTGYAAWFYPASIAHRSWRPLPRIN